MRLMIIRHGDPDYEHDTLTARGWREAEILAEHLAPMDLTEIYVSPLGRARDTASCTLKKLNRQPTAVLDWLREFPAVIEFQDNQELLNGYPDRKQRQDGSFYQTVVWDILPAYCDVHPELFDRNGWKKSDVAAFSDMLLQYDNVTRRFDELLASHGYQRCNNYYQVTRANNDTLVFFCHFGLECILLSHLMNVSPFVFLQGSAFAPTSVSVIYTEERQPEFASFRAARLGDISHLTAAGIQPSFSARFCERYDDWSQRH